MKINPRLRQRRPGRDSRLFALPPSGEYKQLNELFPKVDLEQFRFKTHTMYQTFKIKKASGAYRIISAPHEELKQVQQVIAVNLGEQLLSAYAVGFRKGYSVMSNARVHRHAAVILNLDLANFFPTITKTHLVPKLFTIFQAWRLDPTPDNIDLFCDIVLYKGKLPQGSPCSPALANIICRDLDLELASLAAHHGCKYTRYADDLSFSSKDKTFDIGQLLQPINELVRKHKFFVNYKKTRFLRPHRRMEVTGVVVNNQYSIPRKTRRTFEAIVHNYYKAQAIPRGEYQKLKGFYSWLLSVVGVNYATPSEWPNWLTNLNHKLTNLQKCQI